MGHCGEYSDRCEWPVVAYTDKEKAIKHADAATQLAIKYYKGCRGVHTYKKEALREALGGLDDSAETDYTGTDWFVLEVPLR